MYLLRCNKPTNSAIRQAKTIGKVSFHFYLFRKFSNQKIYLWHFSATIVTKNPALLYEKIQVFDKFLTVFLSFSEAAVRRCSAK